MRIRNFWVQNGSFAQMRVFFRKPVNEPCVFHSCPSTCQKSMSDINLLVKYWRLKNTEISFLTITWEPDFSQACSFCRMLMNHKNFHFTQIPDKTNDVIFLKSPETMFLGHFLTIFGQFWQMRTFFEESGSVTHNYILAPNTMLNFRKKLMSQFWGNLRTDGRTDRRTDRPYFIGPLRSRPGIQ